MSKGAGENESISGRPKTLYEAKAWMLGRLAKRIHPMNSLPVDEGEVWINAVPGLDGESWGGYWEQIGLSIREQAEQASRLNDEALACRLYQKASGAFFMGRFPCPNHPAKQRCAQHERETYVLAGQAGKHPIERIVLPFNGKAGEGKEVVALLRRPEGIRTPPVVLMWGGVDAYKEQMTAASDAFLENGVATLAMDNACTAESPVKGVPDAERQFLTVIDWITQQADFKGSRVGCLGCSFGGYWATKLAHLIPDRLAGVVNWGGGVHYVFQPEWVEASRYPDSYLMELVETRSMMLGAGNDREYVEYFKRLSLLDQGLLDGHCAPMLLVNGKDDKQCPVSDIALLLEHGDPKTVRMFPGGHMGITPQTLPIIVEWLSRQVSGRGVK